MRSAIAIGAMVVSVSAPAGGQAPTMTSNAAGIELVLINPGSFVLGTFQPPYPKPPDPNAPIPSGRGGRGTPLTADEYKKIEAAAKADYMPGFRVTISRPFYIGKYEVTQAQWRRVMGTNPSMFQGAKVQGSSDDHPVDSVTWDDAQAFVRRLNAMEKTTRYRLPTEFEWEYAARAGAEGDIAWTDIRQQAWAGSNRSTQAVGKLKPNAWGLHDMLGNVWEWVQDYYNEKLFADPVPPETGREHVLKGAGFVGDVKNATWMTHAAGPGSKFDVGLRIVRDVGN
jgi:formylglycine-generating enzyme